MVRRQSRVFRRFLVSYLVVLTIPILAGIGIYLETRHVVRDEVVRSHSRTLEQIRESLQSRFLEARKLANFLLSTQEIQLLRAANQLYPAHGYDIVEAVNRLNQAVATNDYAQLILISFQKQKLVITNRSSYPDGEFQREFARGMNSAGSQLLSILESGPALEMFYPESILNADDQAVMALPYVLPLNSKQYSASDVSIVIFLDSRQIRSLVTHSNLPLEGWFLLEYDGRRILTANAPDLAGVRASVEQPIAGKRTVTEAEVAGEPTVLISSASAAGDWLFTIGLPEPYVFESLVYIRRIFLSVVIVVAAIGVLVAFFLTNLNLRPILNLVGAVHAARKDLTSRHSTEPDQDEFKLISSTLQILFQSNQQLREEVSEQQVTMRSLLFEKVRLGLVEKPEEFDSILTRFGISRVFRQATAVIFQIVDRGRYTDTSDTERAIPTVVVSRLIGVHVERRGIAHPDAEGNVTLFYFSESTSRSILTDIVAGLAEEIVAELRNDYGLGVRGFVGDIHESFARLPRAYHEAREALEWADRTAERSPIVLYSTIREMQRTSHTYSLEMESQIHNLCISGNEKEIARRMDRLYAENFLTAELDEKDARTLLESLINTLRRVGGSIGVDVADLNAMLLSDEHVRKHEPQYIFAEIREAITDLARSVSDQTNDRRTLLRIEIEDYLNRHFTDPSLNIPQIAEEVGVSESYFSALFKKLFHRNFYAVLEKKRIHRAEKVLQDQPRRPISEIAFDCGYMNDTSFRRAFKKNTGMSPSDFREMVTRLEKRYPG